MKLFQWTRKKLLRNGTKTKSINWDGLLPNFSYLYQQDDVVINDNCTELEISTNKLTTFILKDLFPVVGLSPYPITEQLLMASAVLKLKPKYIFEWGTHLGISARIFHEVSIKYNLELTIHSIDLPDDIEHIEHPKSNRGIMVNGKKNVVLHQGDGLDKSIEIADSLEDNSNILFFLDGDHEYESVFRELNGIYEHFPNAVILAHDTFYQSSESNYNIGPNLAIKNFLDKHPDHYKSLSTNLGLPGMTLLYRKK
jgi:cephalosporin hydroxylase